MIEFNKNQVTIPGSRILIGNEKRAILNKCIEYLVSLDICEIDLPIINYEEIFSNKVGQENNNMMYTFEDKGHRKLCLAPEYTAIINEIFPNIDGITKNREFFYVGRCFRGERKQQGRYREFTQIGVEFRKTKENLKELQEKLIKIACNLINIIDPNIKYTIDYNVSRGLDYYDEGIGFEIRTLEGMQLLGGGAYKTGIGFALGFDRIFEYKHYKFNLKI